MKECPQCHSCYDDELELCPHDAAALKYTLAGGTLIAEKYRLERLIARGSMGSIYAAIQEDLQRPVAIKFLNPQLVSSNIARERFRREALAIASLKHPYIVTVFDFGSNEFGNSYIVMELLEGKTLAERLEKKGRLDLTEALTIAVNICDALSQAHARGIIHRDLKPSNIFLTESVGGEMTKVIDFGLVKLKERADAFKSITAGALIGSPHYSAPEQCRTSEVDARADIYSLGAILYHMVTGQRPFDTPNKAELIYQQLNTKPLPPHRIIFDIPPQLETVILKALEKDPAARYQTIAEMAAALKQSPKRSTRRTVGMFFSNPLTSNDEQAQKDFQQATQRTLCFEHFVARKRELTRLRQAYDQACEGKVTAILITGDPGIGKTELLAACLRELRATDALCFTGQFTNTLAAPWSLTDLRPYLQRLLAADRTRFQTLFGSLSASVEEAVSDPAMSQTTPTAALFQLREGGRAERTLELLAQVFVKLSEHRPVVITLDDLHLADEASLNFLMYLVGAASVARVLFIFAARAQEIAQPECIAAHWLDRMANQRQLQRLALGPLTAADARALIEKIFEPILISDEAITRLLQLTEGNPFYLVNVLRLMVEEGQIIWDSQQWLCGSLNEIKVPPTVARLIEARLNFLAPESRETLALATILGETFSFESLKRFSGLAEDDLMRVIDDGLRYSLIKEARTPEGSSPHDDYYSFAQHALYQVLYDRFSEEERVRRHLDAAQLFASVEGKQSVFYSLDAARQYQLAHDHSGAFCHLVAASAHAWRVGDVELASQHLQGARKAAGELASLNMFARLEGEIEPATAALATHYCDYLMLSVDLKVNEEPAEESLERALLLAQRLGDQMLIARALVASGHYQQRQGDYPRALNYFERALALYDEMGNKQRYNVLLEQITALRNKVKPHKPTVDIL